MATWRAELSGIVLSSRYYSSLDRLSNQLWVYRSSHRRMLTKHPDIYHLHQTRLPNPLSSLPLENLMLSPSSVSALRRGVLWPLVWNSLDSLSALAAREVAMKGW